jgi:hypothetical protein
MSDCTLGWYIELPLVLMLWMCAIALFLAIGLGLYRGLTEK